MLQHQEYQSQCFLLSARYAPILLLLSVPFHQLYVLTEQYLGLSNPLVALNTAWEELDCFVDLVLEFSRHIGYLSVSCDAKSIQLLLDEWTNSLITCRSSFTTTIVDLPNTRVLQKYLSKSCLAYQSK